MISISFPPLMRMSGFLWSSALLLSGLVAQAASLPKIPAERIDELTRLLQPAPAFFCPPFSDRVFWDAQASLPSAATMLADAKGYAGQPMPQVTVEMHGEFLRTGNRLNFEAPFSERFRRVVTFVLAEGLLNDGSYLPLIETDLAAVLSDPSWAVPAHTRSRPTWEAARDYIDLAAAARGLSIASMDWLLGDRLKPETRQRIRREMRDRIFTPYLQRARRGDTGDFWWMNTNHNWNAVCNAGIVGSALLLLESPRERAEFVAAWETYSTAYLAGFSNDGFCHEGLHYWAYGFGHYVTASELIRLSTAGRLDPLDNPAVKPIAAFAHNWEITNRIYPAFSAVTVRARPPSWLEDFVAIRFGVGSPIHRPLFIHRHSLTSQQFYTTLLDLSLPRPAQGRLNASRSFPLRSWFPEGGALISRSQPADQDLSVAIKGGHNGQPHNHNDLGSFSVVADGRLVISDLGRDEYVKDAFNEKRYTSDLMNSFGHPVPLVAGQMQRTGTQAKVVILRTEFTDTQDIWEQDLTSAYDVPALKRLTRTFTFTRIHGGTLEITDHVLFSTPQNFGNAIILFPGQQRIETGASAFRVERDGKSLDISFSSEGGTITISEQPLKGIIPDQPAKGTRVGLDFPTPVREAVLRLVITPATPEKVRQP